MHRASAFVGFASAFALAVGTAHAQTFDIQPLAPITGGQDYYVQGINNQGQIVGYGIDLGGFSRAVLWDGLGAHELADLSDVNANSEAYRLNNSGQIVGLSWDDDGNARAVLWNGITDPINLGTLSGTGISFAQDINDAGVVVGSSSATTGQHAFTWTQAGGFQDYGSFESDNAQFFAGFNAINNNGLLAGTGYRIFSPFHAAMAQEGVLEVIDISPPGQFSTGMVLAVNDAGTMVGYQNNGSGSPQAAIFHGDGTATLLGTLNDLSDSWASDINEDGVIVGRSFGFDDLGNQVSTAMIYMDGQMLELIDLLPANSGWDVLFSADGINDLGQIVGAGVFNGEIRGYVISIPEPGALGLFALGGLALLRRKR